jgi:hypothetical protein
LIGFNIRGALILAGGYSLLCLTVSLLPHKAIYKSITLILIEQVTLTPKYKLSGVAAKSSMLLLVVISSAAAICFNNTKSISFLVT